MTINKETIRRPLFKGFARVALTAALCLALVVSAYAAGTHYFGWGRGFEFSVNKTEGGISIDSRQGEADPAPVEFRDGRMIFIVNGESIDITDRISQTQPFVYEYEDADGMTHWFILGKNSAAPEDYGYVEAMAEKDGDYLFEYFVNTGEEVAPAWYVSGKNQIGWNKDGN